MGKVLLAAYRYAAAELTADGLPGYTPATITDRDALEARAARRARARLGRRRRGARGRRVVARGADRGPPRRHRRRDRHLRAGRAADARTASRGPTSCPTCARPRGRSRATSAPSRGRKGGVSERYIAVVDQGTASSRCLVFDERSAHRLRQPDRAPPHLPAARATSSTTRRRSGATSSTSSRDALAAAELGVRDLVGLGHHQPARDDRAVGPRDRRARAQRDHLAGHAHGPPRATSSAGTRAATASASAAGCRSPPTSPGRRSAGCSTTSTGLRERAEAGEVLFGTMDSWLIWKLTGRHLTDVTNAGRTMLMNLETLDWDDVLLDAIGVPRAMLPEIRPSMEVYGEAGGELAGLPVAAALGDQHAALFGQTCFAPGRREVHVRHGLLPAHEHRRGAGALGQRAAHDGRLQDRRRARDLRARGLDRGDGRARAVVPRQARADRQRVRDRDARAHGRRQRRLLLRPRVLRPLRAALAQRRARRDRGADRLHLQGPPRPRGAGGDRVADARGRRRDELRRRRRRSPRSRSTAA